MIYVRTVQIVLIFNHAAFVVTFEGGKANLISLLKHVGRIPVMKKINHHLMHVISSFLS